MRDLLATLLQFLGLAAVGVAMCVAWGTAGTIAAIGGGLIAAGLALSDDERGP